MLLFALQIPQPSSWLDADRSFKNSFTLAVWCRLRFPVIGAKMSSAGNLESRLTDDQFALSKTQKNLSSDAAQSFPRAGSPILTREWVQTREPSKDSKGVFRVMTWNVSLPFLHRNLIF
jgi:hypothetical protein